MIAKFVFAGRYTVCNVGGFHGVAMVSDNDEFDEEVGMLVSLCRAFITPMSFQIRGACRQMEIDERLIKLIVNAADAVAWNRGIVAAGADDYENVGLVIWKEVMAWLMAKGEADDVS